MLPAVLKPFLGTVQRGRNDCFREKLPPLRTLMTHTRRLGSSRLDPQFLDDRPPFLGTDFHKPPSTSGACRSRGNLDLDIDESRLHSRIG
jgi:hypothetical protein